MDHGCSYGTQNPGESGYDSQKVCDKTEPEDIASYGCKGTAAGADQHGQTSEAFLSHKDNPGRIRCSQG